VKTPSSFLWDAKIEVAKKSNKKEELLKVLEEALQIESSSFRSVGWRVDLIKENHSQAQKLYEESIKLIDEFWKSPRVFEEALQTTLVGDMTGFEKLLLAFVEGDLRSTYLKQVHKKESDSKEIVDAWKQSIAKSSSLFQKNQPLGPSIRYLNGLILGQQLGEAESLLNSLIQRFPKETDLLRRQLRVLVLQKKFAEAVRVGEKALKNSYGRNEFWTIEFLAQAYKGHGKINEAKQLLDRTLSRSELNQENMKKTKEGLQKIRSSLD
jgi:tetratricopeptide (TPR) repeat protein